MSANFLNTNRNASRYFFATSENGEQTLGLQYGTTGGAAPISTMAVTISGTQGNGVIVTEAPCYLATEFMLAENALMGGTNSTYNTLSSINTTLSGFNISTDRFPGTGITTIESYATNGNIKGYEFLSRGLNSQLLSTNMDSYISSIGRPGATAVLGATGTLAVNALINQNQSVPLTTPGNYGSTVPVFPASKSNVEFGAAGNGSVPIAGASNQPTPYVVLFSTPMTNLNPNTQTLLDINFINSLSSGSQSVNYKVGFSTSTAYTNILQTSYVPGGGFTPSGVPSGTSPQGATNICCMLDSDGINPDGTATLYVQGQLSNPTGAADLIFIKKGSVTEPTRNALVWRPV